MLKLKRNKGQVIVTYNGREILFPKMFDAWQYIFYQRLIALDNGQTIGCHNDTLYPVHSLLPPVVEKTVKFFDLGVEIC